MKVNKNGSFFINKLSVTNKNVCHRIRGDPGLHQNNNYSCHIFITAGAPLIIHLGHNEHSPFDVVTVLEATGADLSRNVIAHLDRTIFDNQNLLELAKRGCYLEYDLFGTECSHVQVCLL